MKKAADLTRRKKKEEIYYKKTQEIAQSNNIWKIAISICQRAKVELFYTLLLNFIKPDLLDKDEINNFNLFISPIPIIQSAALKKVKVQGL